MLGRVHNMKAPRRKRKSKREDEWDDVPLFGDNEPPAERKRSGPK